MPNKINNSSPTIEVVVPSRLDFPLPPARASLLTWYQRNNRQLPWRREFQKSKSPYPIWVSEIMLQQTLIAAVVPKFIDFMRTFPTLHHLAKAPEEQLRPTVAGLGYYRRFANLHSSAKILAAKTKIQWPKTAQEWQELPGIGDYTSAAIASITLKQPVAVLDGNVERVLFRLLDLRAAPKPKHKKKLTILANQLLDKMSPGDFNQAVMELGQLVCTKAHPNCSSCPIKSACKAYQQGSQSLAPASKDRAPKKMVTMALVVQQNQTHTLLVKRPQDAKFLHGTWGFPTYLGNGDGSFSGDGFEHILDIPESSLPEIKHAITIHKISAKIHRNRSHSTIIHQKKLNLKKSQQIWVKNQMVQQKLLSSLDKKVWQRAHQGH